MASRDLRELAIAQLLDAGYGDSVSGEITQDAIKNRNPWKRENAKASIQWAVKTLFGEEFAKQLMDEANFKTQKVRQVIGGSTKAIGGSGILITKKKTI